MAKIKITDIKISPDRIRKDFQNIDDLAGSIRKHGLLHPIVVDGDLNLIAGERRLRAHIVLGLEEIEVNYRENLDDFQKKEIELEENLSRQQLEWHEVVAARKELHQLKQLLYGKSGSGTTGGWRLEDTANELGLDKTTMSLDLALAKGIEQFPELARIPSKKKAMQVLRSAQERAILRELSNRNRKDAEAKLASKFEATALRHGDCIEIAKTISDDSVDLIICDPPFGIGDDMLAYGADGAKAVNFRNDPAHCMYLYANIIPQMFRVAKPGAHAYLFFAIQFLNTVREMCAEAGFLVRPIPLIWVKETGHRADIDWKIPCRYEVALWMQKPPMKPLNAQVDDVFIINRTASSKRIHPMERPYELMKIWVELSSNPGDTVFDPFSGSFVVPHVCLDLDRRCIACEQNEENFQRGQARIEKAKADLIAKAKKELAADTKLQEAEFAKLKQEREEEENWFAELDINSKGAASKLANKALSLREKKQMIDPKNINEDDMEDFEDDELEEDEDEGWDDDVDEDDDWDEEEDEDDFEDDDDWDEDEEDEDEDEEDDFEDEDDEGFNDLIDDINKNHKK